MGGSAAERQRIDEDEDEDTDVIIQILGGCR